MTNFLRAFFVLLAMGLHTQNARAQTQESDALIALFIYNFVNFVEWPEVAFDKSESAINACWYGESAASRFLQTMDGTLIGNRPLNTVISEEIQNLKTGCHVLFVEASRRAVLPDFWKNINYLFVLSVGEQQEFTDKGGIIRIVRTADQLEFDANINNAKEAGIFLSSDLLHLARKIKGLDLEEREKKNP